MKNIYYVKSSTVQTIFVVLITGYRTRSATHNQYFWTSWYCFKGLMNQSCWFLVILFVCSIIKYSVHTCLQVYLLGQYLDMGWSTKVYIPTRFDSAGFSFVDTLKTTQIQCCFCTIKYRATCADVPFGEVSRSSCEYYLVVCIYKHSKVCFIFSFRKLNT